MRNCFFPVLVVALGFVKLNEHLTLAYVALSAVKVMKRDYGCNGTTKLVKHGTMWNVRT